jgi:hypothetical protein
MGRSSVNLSHLGSLFATARGPGKVIWRKCKERERASLLRQKTTVARKPILIYIMEVEKESFPK